MESTENQYPHVEGSEEGGVNINAAKEVLERAEAGGAEREEINEMIKTLQELQNDGINDASIQDTLTRLIAARDASQE